MKAYQMRLVRALTFHLLLAAALLPPTAGAEVFGRGPHWLRTFYPHSGQHIKTLPKGYRPLNVGQQTYFFLGGVFYRPCPGGYVVVGAPIGAVIYSLPAAAEMVTIGPIIYWAYAEAYYRKVTGGYMVVSRPVEPDSPNTCVAWEGERVRVAAALLNVRSGPGKEHTIVTHVKQDDLLLVRSSGPTWYYVQLPDHSFGWVMVKYTALLKPKALGCSIRFIHEKEEIISWRLRFFYRLSDS